MAESGTVVRTIPILDRPKPISPAAAGAQQLGGWLDRSGRFYPAPYNEHIRIAARLRKTGDGPAEPWLMRDWCMVKSHGEVLVLPGQLSQRQLDSLGDILCAAPEGLYQRNIQASLRQIQQMELSFSR
jgi:hypothetical protein